jgi:hypothetical protein
MTYYQTKSIPGSQLALYQLSIRQPQAAFADFNTFTFPLSPASLRTEPTALSSFSNTRGTPLQNGVARIVDSYGLSPPMFTIDGTTGWDRHSTDGYILTGLQSAQLLANFIKEYISLNQTQIQAGNPNLYALEFYDYFAGQFWQVEPLGPVMFRQTNDRPALTFYRLQMAGIKPVRESPYSDASALAMLLGTPATMAVANMGSALTAVSTTYALSGAVVSSVTGGALSALL